ncbi:MAG TPA: bifunctional oligoribonuclease/PAP phosphatase NrnA [Campylobacterales bacterium]|nr:bifunctional oligoribonuclease/PAP phosphatase NrnA [Campylobacterales bacterium]
MYNLKNLIDRYRRVTILSHLRPDGDTIGTALGIYAILKKYKKSVEVVNADRDIPIYLDFLPNFSKIKSKIDFDDSLVICCDGGSTELFGFDLNGRDILNIDHHRSNTNYGIVNIVKANCVSASQVAFEVFGEEFELDKDSATCFYTSLVSDTQYFRTNNMTKEVFDVSSAMIAYDIDISEVAYNLNQRKSLSSLRILGTTLDSLELHCGGKISTMIITKMNIKKSGAKYGDLMGIVDHGISLATVNISIVFIELDSLVRVSLRSKKDINISTLARYYGGGGHTNASGFEMKIDNIEIFLKDLIKKIEEMGLLNGKKKKNI